MQIHRVATSPSFGYKHPLKDLYKKGELPFVKKGFYGEDLDPKNCTLEHLKLHAHGGKTTWDNLTLTSANKNMQRGCQPLSTFINWKAANAYLDQFKGHFIPGFGAGEKYIKGILRTIHNLLKKGE